MRARQGKREAAPKFPLSRQYNDNGDDDDVGMGAREDTSAIPLAPGEVRVPPIRPPPIPQRWASVTMTTEMFPEANDNLLPQYGQSLSPVVTPGDGSHAPFVVTAGAGGMGQREDTSALPLQPGEVRVPKSLRPPTIGDRWASELTSVAVDETFTEMERRVSTMIDDCEDHNHILSSHLHPLSADVKPLQVNPGEKLKRISDHRPRFLFPPPPPPMPSLDCLQRPSLSLSPSASLGFSTPSPGGLFSALPASSCSAQFPALPYHPFNELHAQHTLIQGVQKYNPLMHKKMMRWFQIVELWCVERSVNDLGELGPEVPDSERGIPAPPPRPPMFSEEVAPALEQRKLVAQFSRPHAPYTFDSWVPKCWTWWAHCSSTFDYLRDVEKFQGFLHISKAPPMKIWQAEEVLNHVA